MADAAIQSLNRLRPNSGEAHLALAKHFYWGYLDYDHAREELKLAQQSLPNEPLSFEILALSIDGKAGGLNRPKISSAPSSSTRKTVASSNNSLIVMCVCASMLMPSAFWTAESRLIPRTQTCERFARSIELEWRADPRPLSSTIQATLAEDPREAKK